MRLEPRQTRCQSVPSMWWKIRLALFVALTLGACDCGSDPRATGDAGGPGEDAATEDASTEPDASEPDVVSIDRTRAGFDSCRAYR